MADLSTTVSVLLAVLAGAIIIRLVAWVKARVGGTGSYRFPDLLAETNGGMHQSLVWMALPPVVGGMLSVFWPGTNGAIAGAAGLLAAFLDVWPVYEFPAQLLPSDLQPFLPRIKVLYALFVGMSAALSYFGFVVVDRIVPNSATLSRARIWHQFLDSLVANTFYGPAKYGIATCLALVGIYFNRERVRVARRATAPRA